MTQAGSGLGVVVTRASSPTLLDHERATHTAIAKTLAAVKGFDFGGEYDPAERYARPLYFVPSETLLAETAQALGIHSRDDLFGGVVPFPFVAAKGIVHPLVAPDAQAPPGWSHAFARRVRDLVLPGFTAFSVGDARRAARSLLARGPIRLKPGQSAGGRGQLVIAGADELGSTLESFDAGEIEHLGLVVEPDLADVTTYSIGQVWVGDLRATYCGTQRMTTDNDGASVFGGSDLLVAEGGLDLLEALPLDHEIRRALTQALGFDAATEELAGLFASRRNYDVVRGRDSDGRWHSGVVDQSWRIGGASGPEVAALAAFQADPGLRVVRARCTEAYGGVGAPPGSVVHFDGVDSRVGAITKYTVVEAYELRDEPVEITVDGQQIEGTLLIPERRRHGVPGVLFVHGWSGNQEQYLARARALAALGCVCLTFDLRGHERTQPQHETVTREDNLRDVLAAYDVLARCDRVEESQMALVGSSYGAYLGAIVTGMRPVRWLALRAPAIYKDAGWDLAKRTLHQDPDFTDYRRRTHDADENRALQACARFHGDALVVESEHDTIVPHPVLASYVAAFANAHSLTYRVIEGADHGLSREPWKDAYTELLVTWLKEMTATARGAHPEEPQGIATAARAPIES